jgi:hypothetical protein
MVHLPRGITSKLSARHGAMERKATAIEKIHPPEFRGWNSCHNRSMEHIDSTQLRVDSFSVAKRIVPFFRKKQVATLVGLEQPSSQGIEERLAGALLSSSQRAGGERRCLPPIDESVGISSLPFWGGVRSI